MAGTQEEIDEAILKLGKIDDIVTKIDAQKETVINDLGIETDPTKIVEKVKLMKELIEAKQVMIGLSANASMELAALEGIDLELGTIIDLNESENTSPTQ